MSKNDDKIIELKKNVVKMREELGTIESFRPKTTCMITIDGERINLNTINKIEKLNYIMIKLHMFEMAAKDLGIGTDNFEIDGFTYSAWMADISAKKNIIAYNEKLKQLKNTEAKLEKMLSEDKKVELELLEIEQMLKG